MDEQQVQKLIEELSRSLPKFPDGRIDYTRAKVIYAVSITVEHAGQILFLKRNSDVHFYPNLWNVVSGFIDEPVPLRQIILQELTEETGIGEDQIANLAIAKARRIEDVKDRKQWHIFPVLVQLKQKPPISINWEHTEYTWLKPEEVDFYDRLPDVEENIRQAMELAKLKP